MFSLLLRARRQKACREFGRRVARVSKDEAARVRGRRQEYRCGLMIQDAARVA
jgi:hypothetical protein